MSPSVGSKAIDSIMFLALVMSGVLLGPLGSWDALSSDQPRESHTRTPDLLLTKESIQRVPSGAKRRSEPSQPSMYRRKISRMTTDRATDVEMVVPTQCLVKLSQNAVRLQLRFCPSDDKWPLFAYSVHFTFVLNQSPRRRVQTCSEGHVFTGCHQGKSGHNVGWRFLRNGTRLGR